MLAGVCGGLAEYLNADPTIIRILWVLAGLAGGLGIWMYLAAWLLIPKHPDSVPESVPKGGGAGVGVGIVLILIGLALFAGRWHPLGFFPYWHPWGAHTHFMWGWDRGFDLLPLLVILAGVAYIAYLLSTEERRGPSHERIDAESRSRQTEEASAGPAPGVPRRLYRARQGRMLAGVCAGLAEYFHTDPTLIRLLWILGTLLTTPALGVIAYVIMALVTPESPVLAPDSAEGVRGARSG
jgi:phage shock protein PspC (stress-responsive transcriptional regulator)